MVFRVFCVHYFGLKEIVVLSKDTYFLEIEIAP